MGTERTVGRAVGVLILVQLVLGLVAGFALLAPAFGPPGFLANAAAHGLALSGSALLGLGAGLLSIGVVTVGLPVFRRCSQRMVLWMLALSAAALALVAVENVGLLSMRSLSEAYAGAAAIPDRSALEAVAIVVRSARNWAHYTELITSGGLYLVLYLLLYRFRLIPRLLSGAGIGAVLLQLVAVAAPIFEHPFVRSLIVPLGASQLALAVWLVLRGFDSGPRDVARTKRALPSGAGG